MTADNLPLGAEASRLDRITLTIFRWWQRSGRDFLRAYLLTQLAIATMLVVPLTSVPNSSWWHPVGAVAATLAPIAAWIIHRRRYGWRAPSSNTRAVKWGITAGVALFLATGVVLMVLLGYVGVVIAMLAPQGPAVLVPAIGTGLLGWLAAAHRKRQIDDPIYPRGLANLA